MIERPNEFNSNVYFETPDEVSGASFFENIAKVSAFVAGTLFGLKMAPKLPKVFGFLFSSSAKKIQSLHLAKELEDPIVSLSGWNKDQKRAVATLLYKEHYRGQQARTIQGMEELSVGELLKNAELVKIREGGVEKEYYKALGTLFSKEEVNILRKAKDLRMIDDHTRVGTGIYKHKGLIKDLRSLNLLENITYNAEAVARATRLPFFGFGPMDVALYGFWSHKPTFAKLNLSDNTILGLGNRGFFFKGALYDVSERGELTEIAKGRLVSTRGNIGYSAAVISGLLDETMSGPRTLWKHLNLKKELEESGITYKIFETEIYPHIKGNKELLQALSEAAWETKTADSLDPITRFLLEKRRKILKSEGLVAQLNAELKEAAATGKYEGLSVYKYGAGVVGPKASAIQTLRDIHPMWARQVSFHQAGYKLYQNRKAGSVAVMVDEKQFENMGPIEQAKELFNVWIGNPSSHGPIQYVNAKQLEQYRKAGATVIPFERIKQYKETLGKPTESLYGYKHVGSYRAAERAKGQLFSPEFAFVSEDISETKLFGHVLAERINRLFEYMTGFGIRPSRSVSGQFSRQLTHVALPAYLAFLGLNLTNDIIAGVTGDYVNPKKWIATGIAGLLVGKQALLNVTGVSAVAQHVEAIAPGSTDSLLSEAVGFAGATFAGYKVGKFFKIPKIGFIAGAVAGLGWAIGDPKQDVEDLIDEMAGRKLVPVRSSRGWVLGRQEFKGEGIKYFKPHWYHMVMKDVEVQGRYGSRLNYWLHGTLPGQFLNIITQPFGIGNPYWLEEKGPWRFSYPISNPLLQDVPFIGPALEYTIGRVIKPYKYYVPQESRWSPPFKYDESGLTPDELRSLGIIPITTEQSIPQHPFSFLNQVGNLIRNMQQYTGLIGWGTETLFGAFNKGDVLDSYHSLYSNSRAYYTKEWGGLFSFSEYFRRFVPKRPYGQIYYNPLPAWYTWGHNLPGTLSPYEEDRTYPIDFYFGGPDKIPFGEFRLPGPGFDLAYGGAEEELINYYLMQSYLAPGSKAHKDARTVIRAWITGGYIDYETARKLGWTAWSVSEKLKKGKFDVLDFSSSSTEEDVAYIDFVNKIFKPDTIGSRGLEGKGLEAVLAYNDAVTTGTGVHRFRVPVVDELVGRFWETFSHADIPIPMVGAFLTRKVIHNKTPLEEYEFTRLYSDNFASWDTPFETMISDVLFNAGDFFGLDILPNRVEKESEIIRYLDAIKYQKYRNLESRALVYGNYNIAQKMQNKYKETLLGLDYSSPFSLIKGAFRAMPSSDKPFLRSFMFAPPSDRETIYNKVAPHMQYLLSKAWADKRFYNEREYLLRSDLEAQTIVSALQSKYRTPGIIYHPGYDIKREGIRLMRQEALDIHKLGYWEQEESYYNNGVRIR